MNPHIHLVCPRCNAVNRTPSSRITEDPQCGSCHRSLFTGHPVVLTGTNFQTHVGRSDLPVLVEFWAPSCPACRMMAPVFEQVAARLEPMVRLATVNTASEGLLASRFGIQGIPTLILFRNGSEVARHSGALAMEPLVRWVGAHTPETG